jgi:molybdenum cofactor cytidylyltransferase
MRARHFALVPAAGRSTRMKEPKLLLPLGGQPLILHTIGAWQRSRVDRIVVVVRPDDIALAEIVRGNFPGVELVIPITSPPDMRASLQAALHHIEQAFAPTTRDAFLVAPADMPSLSAPIIDRLIGQHEANQSDRILTPTLAGRRGHPVLVPWPLSSEVHSLQPDGGLNTIVRRYPPELVRCEDLVAASEYPFADIDTPEEYGEIARDKLHEPKP